MVKRKWDFLLVMWGVHFFHFKNERNPESKERLLKMNRLYDHSLLCHKNYSLPYFGICSFYSKLLPCNYNKVESLFLNHLNCKNFCWPNWCFIVKKRQMMVVFSISSFCSPRPSVHVFLEKEFTYIVLIEQFLQWGVRCLVHS